MPVKPTITEGQVMTELKTILPAELHTHECSWRSDNGNFSLLYSPNIYMRYGERAFHQNRESFRIHSNRLKRQSVWEITKIYYE